MKRFLSVLLACAMLLSMVTISHAADAVTVEYWNADSTKITIDLSAEVDADVLKAATVVTQNGKTVDCTVTKRVKTVDGAAEGAAGDTDVTVTDIKSNTNITYEIKPVNGFNFTDVFGITISADITGTAWSKTFMVRKLWIENFDSYTIADGALKGTGDQINIPWQYGSGATYSTRTNGVVGLEDDGNGNKAMFWNTPDTRYAIFPSYGSSDRNSGTIFADTDVSASTYWADGSDARKVNEYNVELDMRFYTRFSEPKYSNGFQIAMSNFVHHQIIYNSSKGIVAGYQTTYNKAFGGIAGTWGYSANKQYQTNNGANAANKPGGLDGKYWSGFYQYGKNYTEDMTWDNFPMKKSDLSDGDWSNDTVNKVSMSVKDKNIKYSLNDFFMSYDYDINYTTKNNIGMFMLTGNISKDKQIGANTNFYYVDNIVVTQVEEVTLVTLDAPTDFVASTADIRFNLNKNISAAALKKAITLKKGDAVVTDFEFTQVADTQYTYSIAPAGGIDPAATYTVEIAAGCFPTADNKGAVLSTLFSKNDIVAATLPLTAPANISINGSGIKFTLDQNVAIDSLKSGLTLNADGVAVAEINVTKVAGETNTFVVAPADGIDAYAKYTLALKAGLYLGVDGTLVKLAQDFASKEIALPTGTVTVIDWNADSTKITIDFSVPVKVNELKKSLTLTENQREVEYTLTPKTQTSPSKGAFTDGATTYVIVPNSGMKLDTMYGINIKAGLSAVDYAAKLASDYTKYFEVDKLWADDFQGYSVDNFKAYSTYNFAGSGYTPENSDYEKVANYVTLKDVDGDKVLRVTGNRPVIMNYSYTGEDFTFADTGKPIKNYAYSAEENYTVELKLDFESNVFDNTKVTDVRFLMRNCAHTNLKYGMGIATGIGNAKGSYFDVAFLNHITKTNGTATQEASTELVGGYDNPNYQNTIAVNPFNAEGNNAVTMSVKNKNIKFFVNDAVFNSYNYTMDVTKYGYLSFFASSNTVAYIDDIIVTKAKEVTPKNVDLVSSDWNADTTKFVVDFNGPVKEDVIKNYVKLYKGTKEVATDRFEVKALNNVATLADNYTFAVIPKDGIEEDVTYTVFIAPFETYGGDGLTCKLATTYKKSFKVDKLIYDYMEYTDPNATDGRKLPWKANNDKATVSIDTNAKVLVLETTASSIVAPYYGTTDVDNPEDQNSQEFANTGMTGYNFVNSHPLVKEENYTLEVKVKAASSSSYFMLYGTGIAHSTTPGKTYTNSSMSAGVSSGTSYKGGIYKSGGGVETNLSGDGTIIKNAASISTEKYTTIAVSTKDTDYKAYIGDTFVHKIHDGIVLSNHGIPQFVVGGTNTYYIDDLIMSKAIEVTDDCVYGELKVTVGDNEVKNLENADKITAEIDVMNVNKDLDCKVVLAIYDSSDKSLVNAVVSDITKIPVGATTFKFKDVEVKKLDAEGEVVKAGNVLEIFFWDGFKDLKPYRTPVTFPVNAE